MRKILANNNAVKTDENYFSNVKIKKISFAKNKPNHCRQVCETPLFYSLVSQAKIANNILRFLHKFSTTLAFVDVVAVASIL